MTHLPCSKVYRATATPPRKTPHAFVLLAPRAQHMLHHDRVAQGPLQFEETGR